MRAPTSSQPQEERGDFDRQAEGDDDRSDGCFKFAGQVLGGRQLRLPASFQRASSLPRRFARSVTPTPAEQEPEARATARTQLRAESSDAELKGSKKRAASTSPSRNEFRRSFKERIPRQLRSLIPARMLPGYNLPPRPTRKAGPVGRTWVKVYDDITYMDDTSQEYYPIVGYTGAPVKVPDANPLPRAPTPPPPPRHRASRRISPTPSQLSEYDNVPRKEERVAAEQNGPQKDTDQDLILQELSNKMRKTNQEVSAEERKHEADRELIMKELTLKQMNGEKELPQPNYENSNIAVERPTARKRENTRFKGRRQKRSGTPVATDRMTNGFGDENVTDSGNQTFETIEYATGEPVKASVPEDEYIVPERKSSPPPRPKRGTKIYDGVSTLERQTPKATDTTVGTQSTQQAEVKECIDAKEPTRPARGVKVYESVQVSKTEESPEIKQEQNIIEDTPKPIQTDAEVVQDNAEQKEDEKSSKITTETANSLTDENKVMDVKPVKPKRGIKVYEDVIPNTELAPKVSSAQVLNEEKTVTEEKSVEPICVSESTSQEGQSTEAKLEEKSIEPSYASESVTQDDQKTEAKSEEKSIESSYAPESAPQNDQKTEAKSEEEPSNAEDAKFSEITSDLPEKPTKPQRGIKLYEDVTPSTTDLTKTSTEESIKPSKPKRGIKLYEDVVVKDTSSTTASDASVVTENKESEIPSKPERGKKVYSGIDFKSPEESKQQEGIPPYATVQKNKDSQMKAATIAETEVPPPIPPKKRARHVVASNEGPEAIPPRPARHLKPRDRSSEAKRSPKRQKTNTQAGATAQEPPQKPTRSSGKSKPKAEPIIGKVTLESGRTPEMSITTLDSESYENMVLNDPVMKFRSRPLPPTPGQTAAEGATSVTNTASPLGPSGTPAGLETPAAKGASLVITANDDSQRCNEAPPAELTSAENISTADGVREEGAVRVSVASNGLQSKPEIINVNTNIPEPPLVASEIAPQTSGLNVSADVTPAPEVQYYTVSGQRIRTCEYCGHPTLDSSQTEANVRTGQNNVGISDVSNVNVVQASLQFRGNIDGSASNDEGVSVECIQKPCFLTAVAEPTEAKCAELKTTDKQATDNTLEENSAPEDKVLSEELSATNVIAKDGTTAHDGSKQASVTDILENTDRKLSVAAEATVGFEECVAETLSCEKTDQCQVQSNFDNERKLSVAAESVEVNFVPESTENLVLSTTIESEKLNEDPDLKTGSDRRLSVAAESVIVNFVPESAESLSPASSQLGENIEESTSKSVPEAKLSVAAESIASDVAETVNVEEKKDPSTGIEVSTHTGDARKMSIAAESVTVESTPESTEVLQTSTIDEQSSSASVESAVSSVVAGEQSSPEKSDRKISVAAENIALAIPESIQVLNPTAVNQENGSVNVEPAIASTTLASVDERDSGENERKISIAAETVALEFMPESTETLDRENLETVNVVATDEKGASSVAAVSVTTGNFADTVTNKSNENNSAGVQQQNVVTEAATDALATQLPGNVPETCPTSAVADSSSSTEQSQETSNLMDTKAPDSLSGSQTSITDDDSVVSVVAKAEIAEPVKESANTSSDASGTVNSSDTVASGDSILKGGVTDINDRLEGISNFLDSMVRNFSPAQVDNASDTFRQSDSSPSVGPVSTSSTNTSGPACSVPVDVSATPELPLTNSETDKSTQIEVDAQLESTDKTDALSSPSALIEPTVQEQIASSFSEAPASLPCTNSSSTSIETSAADGAVPAVSEGTVSPDQKIPIAEAFKEDITVHKDPDSSLASTLPDEERLDSCAVETCTSSTQLRVSQRQLVPSVFDLLDSGLGFQDQSTSEGGSVLMFINGEWHKL